MISSHVKIILWIFIFSGVQMESIKCNELLVFQDFLRAQRVRHALVVTDQPNNDQIESYTRLLASYSLQFYSPATSINFTELFYYGAPRTAILVSRFESEQARHAVYGAASVWGQFNNSQAWLMLGSSRPDQTAEQTIAEVLTGLNINIDADITVALPFSTNISWLLYDVYKVGECTRLHVINKGMWSAAGSYQLLYSFSEFSWMRRRNDFGNITLKGSTALVEKPILFDDLAYLKDDKHLLQLDPMQRKTFQLFILMAHMYNMSLDIRFTNNWGQLQPNGSWSGVMGQVTQGEADFALCPMRFVTDRQRYVQFTPVLHTEYIHFLFRHPRRNSIRNIFFEPLSTQVWWCVLALICGSTLLLLLHIRQEHEVPEEIADTDRLRPVERRLAFVWFTMLETYLQQGPAADLFSLASTRLLVSVSCLFSFMLMQFYGAFIVGSLLSETPRSIVSLQALFQSGLELGMENISYNYALFTNTTNQLVRDVYIQRICRPREQNIQSIQQGAERIRQGGFAFHAAIDRMYRLLVNLLDEAQFCELQEIMFNPPYVSGSVLPKSSPWREHLVHAVLSLRETGLMQYNDKQWTVPKPDCRMFQAAQVEVDLKHIAPALFTLLLAMLTSVVVLLLELLLDWTQRNVHRMINIIK
ncbi:probable glutamate receptor [Drosophila busckii]|uniref:probable glutamate receptor n=1 Tax=Drosophila busckii TaxID=30019 RepID=UPI001432E3F1|nr:probable glutamate receptor [Drosophila busckii]